VPSQLPQHRLLKRRKDRRFCVQVDRPDRSRASLRTSAANAQRVAPIAPSRSTALSGNALSVASIEADPSTRGPRQTYNAARPGKRPSPKANRDRSTERRKSRNGGSAGPVRQNKECSRLWQSWQS
jgi:hypothetical protein